VPQPITPTPQKAGDKIHYEDYEVGKTYAYGRYEVTKEEIIEFATEFDPQAHHIDEAAAKRSLAKGLFASGWHSCAMFMRMLYEGLLKDSASLGAGGIEEVKWVKPVRPGMVLSARSTCTGMRLSKSRPGVGLVDLTHEVVDRNGEVVMTSANTQFIALRNPSGAA
jgi:acyl dehydratase